MWVHGDLHPANVVIADGRLAGVVDFGDLFAADPASDLAAAWVLLPAAAAARFFAAYAAADEATASQSSSAGRTVSSRTWTLRGRLDVVGQGVLRRVPAAVMGMAVVPVALHSAAALFVVKQAAYLPCDAVMPVECD
ncbi:hypothetical protein FAIPA1_310044 [Frankia sp. AiPs1]|nr:phosphotransferase [Frankia sp. AiPa1]MCL9759206.1 phosphotransferase [Frankia sp. AiPa1]